MNANSKIIEKRVINGIGEIGSSINKVAFLFVKRVFDIICAIFGCICILPLMLVVKICNVLSGDFKPIFYTQRRVGKDGEIIHLYKFRSMVPNADEVLKELLKDEKYRKEWEENQKFENDPRITKIGNILRKTSLDEVPQFINVLKGEMSLIGPRPLVEGELEAHDGDPEKYNSMKPGITGWWGCNGRSATTYEERLELEYYYIDNASIMLDIKIIFLTIKAVLCKSGAK